MKVYYKGNCNYCRNRINGNDYIFVSIKKGLMHKKCYELYKKELNQCPLEDYKEADHDKATR